MASKRKSTTPCMVLASEQDPDLEMISDNDEVPLPDMPTENMTAESVSTEEDAAEHDCSDNQLIKKVEGGYECKYCPFQTPDLNMFTFHVDSEHPNVVLNSSYVCVECNFLTKRYDALSEHNLKYHPGEENFKLTMVKRNNQTIFEQTVNDLTFDGNFVQGENEVQHESGAVAVAAATTAATSATVTATETTVTAATMTATAATGISISKTPIMKMKNKTETKRIAVTHNLVEDVEQKIEKEQHASKEAVVDAAPAAPEPANTNKIAAPPPETKGTVVGPAAMLQTGLAQVISAVQAQQNQSIIQKVLIPVTSIPTYNAAMDNNALLLNTYNKFPYPTVSEISILSAQSKYTEEQIKIWFSAQRLKHGISWTPEEVEDARRKQFNGTVHTVPQTITVIPAQISATANGLQPILHTCQIVGQPGLVLTQVASTNTMPVSTPIALTVTGLPSQPQLPKSNVQTVKAVQAPVETKRVVTTVPDPKSSRQENALSPEFLNFRSKKTKEQLGELKVSYLRSQFPQEAEIARLMKTTGLTKGEIKKWFSDTRYNQRNAKNSLGINVNNDSSTTIIIDSSDETSESPSVGPQHRKQSWNFFPDFTPQKFKEKTSEQLQVLEESFLKNPIPTDEELNRLRVETKLTRREIDCWFSERRKAKDLKEEKSEGQDSDVGNTKHEDVSPTGGSAASKLGPPLSNRVVKKSPEQLHLLKSAFVHSQWPSAEEYDKLAEETSLPRSEIVGWFGDTRYAWKNGNLKWYYNYQGGLVNSPNGQTVVRKRGRGRPKGRGRGRPRGRPRGSRRPNWDRGTPAIKFKTGKAVLKDYFLKHRFLNEQDLDELVGKSHMGYEQVREWFTERQRREIMGLEPLDDDEEDEEEEEEEEDFDEDEEEEEEDDTDDSDTWEPPRRARRRISKSDD